jgi:hypothetical protein
MYLLKLLEYDQTECLDKVMARLIISDDHIVHEIISMSIFTPYIFLVGDKLDICNNSLYSNNKIIQGRLILISVSNKLNILLQGKYIILDSLRENKKKLESINEILDSDEEMNDLIWI